eukprot:g14975.t1
MAQTFENSDDGMRASAYGTWVDVDEYRELEKENEALSAERDRLRAIEDKLKEAREPYEALYLKPHEWRESCLCEWMDEFREIMDPLLGFDIDTGTDPTNRSK